MNELIAIHPYRASGLWVFDDLAVGLRQEPFVSGADAIIDRLVQDIPDAELGFTLVFSARPFPGFQAEFEWRREEFSGNWYYCHTLNKTGWLCPALLKYFDPAPRRSMRSSGRRSCAVRNNPQREHFLLLILIISHDIFPTFFY
jgi:hypothetical protein